MQKHDFFLLKGHIKPKGILLDGNSVKVSVVENSNHYKEKNLLKKRGVTVPNSWKFRDGPVVRTWCSHCWGPRFNT